MTHRTAVDNLPTPVVRLSYDHQHFEDIADAKDRDLAEKTLTRFDKVVVPRLSVLPRQVVHGDANDYNVLVESAALSPLPDGAGTVSAVQEPELAGIGVFDFGDMVETARVCNLVSQWTT